MTQHTHTHTHTHKRRQPCIFPLCRSFSLPIPLIPSVLTFLLPFTIQKENVRFRGNTYDSVRKCAIQKDNVRFRGKTYDSVRKCAVQKENVRFRGKTYDSVNLVPRAFSSFKMAVGETPGQGCRSGSKSSLEFRHANTMKCLRFV